MLSDLSPAQGARSLVVAFVLTLLVAGPLVLLGEPPPLSDSASGTTPPPQEHIALPAIPPGPQTAAVRYWGGP